ncbi:MAG: hypothetical protein RI842_03225 [Schleiferiaceae bacterium]|nr:hypothetical protein [Schleiferiaceae bacterium]
MHATKVLLPLLFMSLCGYAQSPRPELSLSLHPSPSGHSLALEATYRQLDWEARDTLSFILREGQVQGVRLLEGRLKDTLPFVQQDSLLHIWPGTAAHPRSGLAIRYHYPLKKVAQRRVQVHRDSVSWAINWLNGGSEKGLGLPGLFYPVPVKGGAMTMRFNLSLPREWPLKIGGAEPQFHVDEPGQRHHFWASKGPIAPAHFFLAAGAWTAPDAEDREALLARQAERQKARQVASFRARHQALLAFLGRRERRLLTTEVGLSILEAPVPPDEAFYLRRAEWPLAPAQVNEQRKIALDWFRQDTTRAAEALFRFAVQRNGAPWRDSLLQARLERQALGRPFWWEQYLSVYLAREGLSWADTGRPELPARQQAVLALSNTVRRRQQPLSLQLAYRYQAQEERFYIYLQSDSVPNPLQLPLEIHLQGQDTSLTKPYLGTWGRADTVSIAWPESPRNAYTSAAAWAPITWQEKRPLNWYLYELTRAPDPERRAQALYHLLQAASGNLLPTVIGIALDSERPRQQRLALEQAHRMDSRGRAKLKATFEQLARDSVHRDIRLKAAAWLQRHYP